MAFTPTVFGPELARILSTLAAVQVEESKRYNRVESLPLMGIFTNPVGTSWFEADMLTRHFYANHASLEALLGCECVPGASETLEWRPGDAAGPIMLRVRQMLLARFVEVASSLQAGISPALASTAAPPAPAPAPAPAPPPPKLPPRTEPVTRWPLRQHAPLYGMIRQTEHAPPPPAPAPLPMQPWRCPVMVPISFFQDQGRSWELLPPPVPCPEQNPRFRRAATNQMDSPMPCHEDWSDWPSRPSSAAPSRAGSVPPPAAEPAPRARLPERRSPGPEEAMDTGSRPQSPGGTGPATAPAVPARREPRWLMPRADSVPPATPESESLPEARTRLEPPNLTDAGWFSGEQQDEPPDA
jgi:hypothetical protein